MDGLLPLCGVVDCPFLVPYYGPRLSTSDISSHNARYETPIPRHRPSNQQSLQSENSLALIQQQLFFDPLTTHFFKGLCKDKDFVQDGFQQRVIRIEQRSISLVVLKWQLQMAQLPREQQLRRIEALEKVLDDTELQCSKFDNPGKGDAPCVPPQEYVIVLLSVRLLTDYLRNVVASARLARMRANKSYGAHRCDRILSGDGSQPLPPGGRDTYTARLILDLFSGNGWCPVQAQRLCERAGYIQATSLSCMKQQEDGKDHKRCQSAQRCVSNNLLDEEVKSYHKDHAHASECPGNCSSSQEQLAGKIYGIVESGRIPIISINPMKDDLDLRVTQCDGTITYTAISHVWSDGLGNPNSNKLNFCKLSNIRDVLIENAASRAAKMPYVERVFRTIARFILDPMSNKRLYFWLDTFCIPVSSSRPELKRLAIRHITPVFQGADDVLVLDAGLRKCPMKPRKSLWRSAYDEEITAHILASKWVRRAWTLEEGALARECQVQLARGSIRLGDIARADNDWFQTRVDGIWCTKAISVDPGNLLFRVSLRPLLSGTLNEFRKNAITRNDRHERKKGYATFAKTRSSQFVMAWNELLERSSTEYEERLLILGNILDFNTRILAEMRVEERLPSMISSCGEIPMSLMFNSKIGFVGDKHPNRTWLPNEVSGDRLVESAIIVQTCNDSENPMYQSNLDGMICIMFDSLIPYKDDLFRVIDADGLPLYVVQVHKASSIQERHQHYYNSGLSTYVVIDPQTGTRSPNGYTGRGARFTVRSQPTQTLLLGFDHPLTAWTMEQWRYKSGDNIVRCAHHRVDCLQTTTVELEQGELNETLLTYLANCLRDSPNERSAALTAKHSSSGVVFCHHPPLLAPYHRPSHS
jgi:hypothetical protein